MASSLRIATVSYVDDNFGDNLIGTSFLALLEVALENYGLSSDDYELAPLSLKGFDESLLERCDAIFFAGGGLFGQSYLGFYEHMDRITAAADERGIPVVFSSMGLNNMGADGGRVDAIAQIVNKRCVRALSVRENLPLFQEVAKDATFEVRQVADPATWTKFVYGMTDVVPDGTIGINVVRGGLFRANQRDWGLSQEMSYLADLVTLAESHGMTPKLYTNGSLGDNNTLRLFADKHGLSDEQIILPQTTREVVQAIATRSKIASIRMHSSIISYSFGIPTVALEWNDKLPHFYEAIGHPERVLPFDNWDAEQTFQILDQASPAPEDNPKYTAYLMSTYAYIHETLGAHVLNSNAGAQRYDFQSVADSLVARSQILDTDEFDLRRKLGKAEKAYLKQFTSGRKNRTKLGTLTKKVDSLSSEVESLSSEVESLTRRNAELQTEINRRFSTRLAGYVRRVARPLFQRRTGR